MSAGPLLSPSERLIVWAVVAVVDIPADDWIGEALVVLLKLPHFISGAGNKRRFQCL